MLWVEEESPERDTAAGKKVCPKSLSYEHLQRFSLEFSLTTYSFLDLSSYGLGTTVRFTEVVRTQNDVSQHLYAYSAQVHEEALPCDRV